MKLEKIKNYLDGENSKGMYRVDCDGYIAICLSEMLYLMKSLHVQSLWCVVTYPATSYSQRIDLTLSNSSCVS